MSTDNNWINVQKKTFTKWINSLLKKNNIKDAEIKDLKEDIKSGIPIMHILRILTSKAQGNTVDKEMLLKHFNQNPVSRIQKMENWNSIITYVQSKTKLVNVGAPDIVDSNEKLILGFIWTLIIKFSILGTGDGEEDATTASLKRKILNWCRAVTAEYDNVDIKDFTKSWKDGLAFNAIVHHFEPEMVGNYDNLRSSDADKNLDSIFNIADKKLNIPKLLDVEDLTESIIPDEKSVFTYVSQYYNRFYDYKIKNKDNKNKEENKILIDNLINFIHEYEKEAQELINLDSKSKNEITILLEIIEKLIEKFMNIQLLSKNKEDKFLQVSLLLGKINTVLKYFNFQEYIPSQTSYKIDNLRQLLTDSKYEENLLEKNNIVIKNTKKIERENVEDLYKTLCATVDIKENTNNLSNNTGDYSSSKDFYNTMNNTSSGKVNAGESQYSTQTLLGKKEELIQQLIKNYNSTKKLLSKASNIFKSMDSTNKGYISFDEVLSILSLLGIDSKINIKEDGDENKEKVIEYEEFMKIVENSLTDEYSSIKVMKNGNEEVTELVRKIGIN
ncbi:Alpha-actinin [Spraguea lophii 42_110]|uniref:Alpha-actinin n=1 Tax=Spraguea lophii (strain 42_110) TaxID=1358809 RepID=S7WBV7_SPRLO|nr:Alpha-actinin [Spraguea lophii 42_110]